MMVTGDRILVSGNEAVALAALHGGIALGTGYPGTPSTEILERFAELGGRAQWAPNEKVALEVGLGAAFGGGAALVTMKHVGLNVAADPLFTAAYTGVDGPLVIVSADDPGLASSQNEQDNRRYAVAAGLPMLEPSDSQEAYDFTLRALEVSARWHIPVLLRMTTRVCHSKTVVCGAALPPSVAANPSAGDGKRTSFRRDIVGRVMIPAYAGLAHRRLRRKLAEIAAWNETSTLNVQFDPPSGAPNPQRGIIASGISVMHAREAALAAVPDAAILKLGMTYPLPMERIRRFANSVGRCLVVEEGDPYLVELLRAGGITVEGKPEAFRFGELSVDRVRRILAGDTSPEPALPPGTPPQLCVACPHRTVFDILRRLNCIVSGDIGCYTLGVLPPFEAMDSCVCMGASITVGLGLRHVLADDEARRVVSVIGDSTFVHSGIPGLVEMIYNPPKTGHVVLILDNGTTAMTGLQEHPGTGRTLDHQPTGKVNFEVLARALGIKRVSVIDPFEDPAGLERQVRQDLAASGELSVIIARRPCVLAAGRVSKRDKEIAEGAACQGEGPQ
jgi:indolepyruvate ferredoxin oxidoreductase alpha subunit